MRSNCMVLSCIIYHLLHWQLAFVLLFVVVSPQDSPSSVSTGADNAVSQDGLDDLRQRLRTIMAGRAGIPTTTAAPTTPMTSPTSNGPDAFLKKWAPPEYDLFNEMLKNYSNSCRPRRNALSAVEVKTKLELFAINDVREREHTIVITATLVMEWMDDFLIWNNSRYSALDVMVFPTDRIWIPDFAMITAENMYMLRLAKGIMVNVYSDGRVNFNPKTGFKSTCAFDLTYFPFDNQVCNVTFESWSYLPKAQFFGLQSPPVSRDKYIENEQWNLTQVTAFAYVSCPYGAKGSSCNAGITFTFYLDRKSNYYSLNIIIPAVIISIAELATFTIPIGEPMKIHISFTCLLAFSVFQTAINADMPRTSDHTPLLSMYIVLIMAYIAFAILGESFVFFSLALAKRKTPLPEIIKLCFIYVGRVLYISREKVEDLADDVLDESHEKTEEQEIEMPRSIRAAIGKTAEYKSMEDKYGMNPNGVDKNGFDTMIPNRPSGLDRPLITPDVHARDWFYVALVSSRLTSVVYLILITLTPLFMFLATPAGQERPTGDNGNLTVTLEWWQRA